VPALAVWRIHSEKLTVEPGGIVPDKLGTPAWVSNCSTTYWPGLLFFKSAEVSAALLLSGPVVFS